MNILALDPAQKCGWADSEGHHGVWLLTRGAANLGDQHVMLFQHLEAHILKEGCDLIATENAGFGSNNPNVQAMHNERLGIIRYVAALFGCDVKTFSPATVKLFATGNGDASKPQMIAAARRLLGITGITDDEADAIWIRELAKREDCWPEAKEKKRIRWKPKTKKSARLF